MAGSKYIDEFFEAMTNEENDEFHPNVLKFSQTAQPFKCDYGDFETCDLPLGEGGFAVVLKARHIPTQKLLALKFQKILFDLKSDEAKVKNARDKTYKLIKREINGLRKADTPYVTSCYGILVVDQYVVICMELMDFTARDLYKEVKKAVTDEYTRFDEKALSVIGASILKALHYLQKTLQLIHRDIKPTNILLSVNGDVKLSDFGLAVCLETSSVMSAPAGTYIYIAPEIIDQALTPGNENKVKFKFAADLWSLGITLIEIARLHHPYGYYNTQAEAIIAIAMGDPPFLSDEDGYDKELTRLIKNCLARNPELRPSVEDLIQTDIMQKFDELEKNKSYMKDFVLQYIQPQTHEQQPETSESKLPSDIYTAISKFKI